MSRPHPIEQREALLSAELPVPAGDKSEKRGENVDKLYSCL